MNVSPFDVHSSRARATNARHLPLEPIKDTRPFPIGWAIILALAVFWVGFGWIIVHRLMH